MRRLEKARPADLPAVAAMEAASFPPFLALKLHRLRYLLRRPTAAIYVLRDGGEVVAESVVLFRLRRLARIYSLAVAPKRRREGLGATMLAETLKALRRRGVREARLEVDPANIPAVNLYKKMGFLLLRRLPDYYAPGRPGIRMRLRLE